VAIIDTGVDENHDVLKPVLLNPNVPTVNCPTSKSLGFDFYNTTYPPSDDAGHGTHVAGIISSFSVPMYLTNLKITRRDTTTGEDRGDLFSAICALKYAIREQVDIINCSWGFYAKQPEPMLINLMQQAQDRGVMIVASAGNDSTNISNCRFWPAGFAGMFPNVITVAAWNDAEAQPGTFTNYGSEGTVFASGVDIISTVPDFVAFGGGSGGQDMQACQSMTGTSMAAPVVSGLLAEMVGSGTPFQELKQGLQASTTAITCQSPWVTAWNRFLPFNNTVCE